MLDLRVYRAAFPPAVLVLVVAAFSLGDVPSPATTRVAPDAFDAARAFGSVGAPLPGSLLGMAEAHPDRRPGSADDLELARFLQRSFVSTGFADADDVRRVDVEAETIDGRVRLPVVLAERDGLSSRRILLVAARDALRRPGTAELSGTAALLELARIFADRDLRLTVVLASVSGATGGHAGAREAARRAVGATGAPVEAALVLGDLASRDTRRPWTVPWATSGPPAPHALRRTVERALRTEAGTSPGAPRALLQWIRRVAPVTVSGQGVVNAEGPPAVLVSATGELGPAPGAEVSRRRLRAFGRAVLRSFTALEEDRSDRGRIAPDRGGIAVLGRLLPDWAVRLLVLALLAPALVTALDAFFRARRRRLPMGGWILWAASWALPFLAAWLWLRALDVVRAVPALAAPGPPGAAELGTGQLVGLGSALLAAAAGWVARRRLLAIAGPRGDLAAGGAAAAVALLTSLLALLVWVANPYAAAVLVVAAHAWLLAPAPEARVGAPVRALAVVAGVLPAVLVLLGFAATLDLSLGELVRLAYDLVAGGELGLLDALATGSLAGLIVAVTAVLVAGPGKAARPDEPLRTRGPGTYAGPGSLGGTKSALRR